MWKSFPQLPGHILFLNFFPLNLNLMFLNTRSLHSTSCCFLAVPWLTICWIRRSLSQSRHQFFSSFCHWNYIYICCFNIIKCLSLIIQMVTVMIKKHWLLVMLTVNPIVFIKSILQNKILTIEYKYIIITCYYCTRAELTLFDAVNMS